MISPYVEWDDVDAELGNTRELDLSERLVWIVEPERMYLKLVMNAQLNADGTCKMADGTVKYWKPFKY